MTTSTHPKGKVRLYACGGAGINIGRLLEQYRGSVEPAFATLDIAYVDTSRSNLHTGINHEHCYLLDGLDGSGKIRSENHEEISKQVRAILQHFKPTDLNIVLSSTGGGSGSVFAPLIVSELLANEAPTIVIGVGSIDTRLEAENTLKTLKSYDAIAKKRAAPVAMLYFQNNHQGLGRKDVDKEIDRAVLALCVLFSRENRELDSRDLFNWLRFDRATSYSVQLASLTLVEGNDELSLRSLGNIISVATLARDGEATMLSQVGTNAPISQVPEYQCVGYLPPSADTAVGGKAPLHFITSDGILPTVAKQLDGFLKDLEQQKNARIQSSGVLGRNDDVHDTGLVL